jgi:molybdopterin/thiamine biosynthesis adenylyltransferase
MALDFRRIQSAVDVEQLRRSHVLGFGAGGAANLYTCLARSGVGRFTLVDPETVAPENLVRQDYTRLDIGQHKVASLAFQLRQIDPDISVTPLPLDFTTLTDEICSYHLRDVDLITSATDSFAMQRRANELALMLGISCIMPGIYFGGLGGEVFFWIEGLPCYRCVLARRYEAQERAKARGESLDPSSDGTTIWEDSFIDVIAGMLALGLLTRGADNRYGRLIERPGDRNYLKVKLDPDYTLGGKDVVRELLGIAPERDTFFAWNVAALRDPAGGRDYCRDCERYLGKKFPKEAPLFDPPPQLIQRT